MNNAIAVETRRARLLASAPELAETHKLDQLTPTLIARAAGLAEADFAVEFGSVADYVAALHTQFLDDLLSRMMEETAGLQPGLGRVLAASHAQLDACLEQRALRAWLVEARRKFPRVAEELHVRTRGTAMMISMELSALGCKKPMIVARLYGAMMLEAAQMEADAGAPVAEVRQALRDLLNLWIPRWAGAAAA